MCSDELGEGDLVLGDIGGEVGVLEEDVADLGLRAHQRGKRMHNEILLTSHSVAPPMLPEEIPETQSPVRSLGSTGVNKRSSGWISKVCPEKVNATEAVDVQGMVNPP